MTAISTLVTVKERGWRMGFANLLHNENLEWWGSRRWLKQASLWLLILNGMVALLLWVLPAVVELTPDDTAGSRNYVAMGSQAFFQILDRFHPDPNGGPPLALLLMQHSAEAEQHAQVQITLSGIFRVPQFLCRTPCSVIVILKRWQIQVVLMIQCAAVIYSSTQQGHNGMVIQAHFQTIQN